MQNYKITTYKMIFQPRLTFVVLFSIFLSLNLFAQKDKSQTIKTICIDAGHGGKDPGCHGASANEKTVCLSIALKLGAKIKEQFPGIDVVYTRDSDVFVELDDRAKIANKHNADLFVCIHANSASPAAYGTETFVLGLHRTESQQKIADRENSTIYLEDDKGSKYKDFDLGPDAIIARQLQLSIFLDQSILFASKLQQEFKRIGRYDRGVKQAGFIVLYKTTMPSVLIETGFLTNQQDELFLKNPDTQEKMAGAIFDAFKSYKSDLEGVDVIKSTQKDVTKNREVIKNKEPLVQEAVIENKSTFDNETVKKNNITFRVQIETSDKKLSMSSNRFKGIQLIEINEGNLFKYLTGSFEGDFEGANRLKNDLRAKGFHNAFVVAFEDGVRINIEKGIRLAKKK